MKKEIFICIITLLACTLSACSEENDKKPSDLDVTEETSTEEATTEECIPKVEVLSIAEGNFTDWKYGDIDFEHLTGFVMRMTETTITFQIIDFRRDDTEPNDFSITFTDEISTFEVTKDVEVWALIEASFWMKIPFEDIDNYEAMKECKAYWMPLLDEEGKVYAILERYVP